MLRGPGGQQGQEPAKPGGNCRPYEKEQRQGHGITGAIYDGPMSPAP